MKSPTLDSGLTKVEDSVGIYHFRPTHAAPTKIRRFHQFINMVLQFRGQPLQELAIHLVAFDGISISALKQIDGQGKIPYWHAGKVFIEWDEVDPPRTERRQLSGLSATLWQSVLTTCRANPTTEDGLWRALIDHLEACSLYSEFKDPEKTLEDDAMCWWYQCMPPPLFSHLMGVQVLSALPRSARARADTKMALTLPDDGPHLVSVEPTDLGLTEELLDAADLSNGQDISNVHLLAAIQSLTIREQETDGVTKRRWAQNFAEFRDRARSNGPLTCIVLAWGTSLSERGTQSQPNLARSTVKAYFSKAALPVWTALKQQAVDCDFDELTGEILENMYQDLISSASAGSKKTMASALSSFHSFLMDAFDIARLTATLHKDVPQARVHAQYVWPHELASVKGALTAIGDVRMRDNALAILGIACEAPARTNELLRLRLANIRLGEDALGECCEIEIARAAHLGRLKSATAQRRLIIRSNETISLLKVIFERRKNEGGAGNSLLFGDPMCAGKPYRAAVTVSHLNRLLKWVSGDLTLHVHSLRHTVISTRIGTSLCSSSLLDVNPIVLTSCEAGHATARTTLVSYFHTYEDALRIALDAVLVRLIPLQYDHVSVKIGGSPVALRKQVERSNLSRNELLWHRLLDAKCPEYFEVASKPFCWAVLTAPPLMHVFKRNITAPVVLMWLMDLSLSRVNRQILANRHNVEVEHLAGMETKVKALCAELARRAHPRKNAFLPNDPKKLLSLAMDEAGLDLARAGQQKFKKLADWLANDPSQELLNGCIGSWKTCRQGKYIRIDKPGIVLGLYQLLDAAGVDPMDLRLSFDDSAMDARHSVEVHVAMKRVNESAQTDFVAIFGVQPRLSVHAPHSSSPSAYLLWDGPGNPQQPKEAAASVAGLDAWIFSITALGLFKGENHGTA